MHATPLHPVGPAPRHPATTATRQRRVLMMLAGMAALLAGPAGHADGSRLAPRTVLPQSYQQECAACHLAYPPGLLPAESWRRLMNNLPRHFGTDASLDVAAAASILDALVANSARGGRAAAAPPDDRITRSSWFVREHRKITPATWKLATVKSPANCIACHTRADQGDFDEDTVRIPR